MILERRTGNIFGTECKHIMFAVNTEGINDSGFAGRVSHHFWPELAYCGPQLIGTVLSKKEDGGKTFHAIVCHSLKGGWKEAPKIIEECLDTHFFDVSDDESIASVQIGGGLIGQFLGADMPAIIQAMERSKKKIILYTR